MTRPLLQAWLSSGVRALARLRSAAFWSRHAPGCANWWDLAPVRARWNELITGRPDLDPIAWITRSHLPAGRRLLAVTLGSGDGQRELAWARTGRFSRITGYDLAPARVAAANARAQAAGLSAIVHFEVGDCSRLALPRASLDLVYAAHVLHHLDPVAPVVSHLAQALRPDGLFVVDDYVGPARLQWRPRQLALINELLAMTPPRYRRTADGRLRRRVRRPSALLLRLRDPSEAIAPETIIPALQRSFALSAVRPYGGTVLHPLLSGIAQCFADDDDVAQQLLRMYCAAEDAALARGALTSDFVVVLAHPRDEPRCGS